MNKKAQYSYLELIVLDERSSIKEVIEALDKSKLKTVYLVDKNKKLLGSINDGDLRRSFHRRLELNALAIQIANRKPIIGSTKEPQSVHRAKIQQYNLYSLPLVNEELEVTDVILNTSLITIDQKENPVLIMAGGFGKRLGSLTLDTPKPLIEVGGQPIILHILQNLSGLGYKNFYISIHFLSEKVKNLLGNGDEYGVKISYIEEDTPLGTAGCLYYLQKRINDHLVMLNGDVFSDVNFDKAIENHVSNSNLATVVVRNHYIKNPYGTVKLNGNEVCQIEEKPVYTSLINTGIYVISPTALFLIKENEKIDMPEFLMRLKDNKHRVGVYKTDGYWIDVGQPTDLAEISRVII
jgi:dTDP-glucose pyrophosphorylase/CBS domain-containing protein